LYLLEFHYLQAGECYRRAAGYVEQVCRLVADTYELAWAAYLQEAGEAFWQAGHYREAEAMMLQCLQLREARLQANDGENDVENDVELARALNLLGLIYWNTGEYAQALPLYQRVLDITEKVQGREHPATANSLNSLAGLYRAMGEYAQALPLVQRALGIQEKILGREHPDTANSLNNLAGLYYAMQDYAQALPLAEEAWRIYQKMVGNAHPHTQNSANTLALIQEKLWPAAAEAETAEKPAEAGWWGKVKRLWGEG
jgi:tetratricopeptide (TPR) repeat protein